MGLAEALLGEMWENDWWGGEIQRLRCVNLPILFSANRLEQGFPPKQVQDHKDHFSLCDLKVPNAHPDPHKHAYSE